MVLGSLNGPQHFWGKNFWCQNNFYKCYWSQLCQSTLKQSFIAMKSSFRTCKGIVFAHFILQIWGKSFRPSTPLGPPSFDRSWFQANFAVHLRIKIELIDECRPSLAVELAYYCLENIIFSANFCFYFSFSSAALKSRNQLNRWDECSSTWAAGVYKYICLHRLHISRTSAIKGMFCRPASQWSWWCL